MKFRITKRAPIRGVSSGVLSGPRRPTPTVVLPKPRTTLGPSAEILAHEARAAADFTAAFEYLATALETPSIVEAIQSGDLATILDVLDLLEWLNFETKLRLTVTGRVRDVIAYEGQRSYDEVHLLSQPAAGGRGTSPPQLPPTTYGEFPDSPGPRGGFYATTRFDMTNPFAVREAESFAADLVREVSRSTRTAIRDAVVDSFRTGITGDALARRLRNTIGLTSRQARAVDNYRDRLLHGGMDEDRVDVLTRRYWRKTRNRRAQTIARTEIMRASNFGRMQGWLSAADHGMLDLNQSTKEWITAPEGPSFDPSKPDVCPVCAPMDGVKVMGVETPFHTGRGTEIQMPPAHPNCRCTAVVWPPEPPEDWDPEYPHASV